MCSLHKGNAGSAAMLQWTCIGRIIMDRKTLNPGQQFDIDAIADCYWPWNAACC